MAFNMYEQLPKVKTSLKDRGFTENIPLDVFIKELMVTFGMRRKTAIDWSRNFEDVDLIHVVEDKVNFV